MPTCLRLIVDFRLFHLPLYDLLVSDRCQSRFANLERFFLGTMFTDIWFFDHFIHNDDDGCGQKRDLYENIAKYPKKMGKQGVPI